MLDSAVSAIRIFLSSKFVTFFWLKLLSEVPHCVASDATYEGRHRGVNPISVVTECDWHSKGCARPVTSNSHSDPES